jgi:hypothetical protein
MSSPTFIAKFADGEITRMSVFTSTAKLDVNRGVHLSRHAYRSRKKKEPPAIVDARFEQEGQTLKTYDADALAAAGDKP